MADMPMQRLTSVVFTFGRKKVAAMAGIAQGTVDGWIYEDKKATVAHVVQVCLVTRTSPSWVLLGIEPRDLLPAPDSPEAHARIATLWTELVTATTHIGRAAAIAGPLVSDDDRNALRLALERVRQALDLPPEK